MKLKPWPRDGLGRSGRLTHLVRRNSVAKIVRNRPSRYVRLYGPGLGLAQVIKEDNGDLRAGQELCRFVTAMTGNNLPVPVDRDRCAEHFLTETIPAHGRSTIEGRLRSAPATRGSQIGESRNGCMEPGIPAAIMTSDSTSAVLPLSELPGGSPHRAGRCDSSK